MKARLKGAQKGHSLLKKKADALTMRFRQILKKIIEVSKGDGARYVVHHCWYSNDRRDSLGLVGFDPSVSGFRQRL